MEIFLFCPFSAPYGTGLDEKGQMLSAGDKLKLSFNSNMLKSKLYSGYFTEFIIEKL